jgi:hypothetical protein
VSIVKSEISPETKIGRRVGGGSSLVGARLWKELIFALRR